MMSRLAPTLVVLLGIAALVSSYEVQRAPMEQSWIARMIGRLLTNMHALPCPKSSIQLSREDFNMLNSLLGSAYLNKNIHFRAAKRALLLDAAQFAEENDPILPMMTKQRRVERRTNNNPQEIAQILPNKQICFAGVRLDHKLPPERGNAQNFVDIINAFSQYMSHNQAMRSGTFRRLSLDNE